MRSPFCLFVCESPPLPSTFERPNQSYTSIMALEPISKGYFSVSVVCSFTIVR
jgi:hypothetical protein